MSRIFDALRQSEKDRQPGAVEPFPPAIVPSTAIPEAEPATDGVVPQADVSAAPQAAVSEARAAAEEFVSPVPMPPMPAAPPAPAVAAEVSAAPPAAGSDAELLSLLSQFTPAANEARPEAAVTAASTLDWSRMEEITLDSSSSRFVAFSSERGLGAEKFRVLGARLSNIRLNQKLNLLQVTSSVVGEGKTLTAVNLAMTLANRFDQRVLLAEGDLRKPAVCKMLGLEERRGIGEWFDSTRLPIQDVLLRVGVTGLCLLPAGHVPHPATVLQSERLSEMLRALSLHFDWIIVDTPPLLPMADSNQWSRICDGTLMVVRKGVASRSALKKAVESLDNPKILGVVLNDASNYDRVNYYDRYYTPRGEKPGA
ncbi:MAG: polysaccharide biosynthesis tyrosine autokinase [Acidobacteriota bacterium]|nr:polysaccharide biosynthesis tyrosine autokinase [Acidobacteriota bacterium]